MNEEISKLRFELEMERRELLEFLNGPMQSASSSTSRAASPSGIRGSMPVSSSGLGIPSLQDLSPPTKASHYEMGSPVRTTLRRESLDRSVSGATTAEYHRDSNITHSARGRQSLHPSAQEERLSTFLESLTVAHSNGQSKMPRYDHERERMREEVDEYLLNIVRQIGKTQERLYQEIDEAIEGHARDVSEASGRLRVVGAALAQTAFVDYPTSSYRGDSKRNSSHDSTFSPEARADYPPTFSYLSELHHNAPTKPVLESEATHKNEEQVRMLTVLRGALATTATTTAPGGGNLTNSVGHTSQQNAAVGSANNDTHKRRRWAAFDSGEFQLHLHKEWTSLDLAALRISAQPPLLLKGRRGGENTFNSETSIPPHAHRHA